MNRFCDATGVAIMPWSPLFGGKLARPAGYTGSTRSQMKGPMNPDLSEAELEIVRRVEEVAGKKGWSMSHVALAWIRAKGGLPVTGFNSIERVDEACELRGKSLTAEEVKYLEEPYVPKPVVGHY